MSQSHGPRFVALPRSRSARKSPLQTHNPERERVAQARHGIVSPSCRSIKHRSHSATKASLLIPALSPPEPQALTTSLIFHLLFPSQEEDQEWNSIPVHHGHQACGLVRRARSRRRRLRPRRAGGAGPHLPLRLHRSRRRHGRRGAGGAGRGHADCVAGRCGARAGAGRGCAGDGGVPRLRWAPEPGGDAGAAGARAHHGVQVRAVRGGPAAGLLPRLHPPPLPHRWTGYSSAQPGRRHGPHARPGHGGHPHLLPPLRRVRDDPRPAKHCTWVRTDAHRPHRRCKHPRRRQLLRRVHEPCPVLRPRVSHRSVDQPLDLLGRPAGRWPSCRVRVRDGVHGQEDARASARMGLLERRTCITFAMYTYTRAYSGIKVAVKLFRRSDSRIY